MLYRTWAHLESLSVLLSLSRSRHPMFLPSSRLPVNERVLSVENSRARWNYVLRMPDLGHLCDAVWCR